MSDDFTPQPLSEAIEEVKKLPPTNDIVRDLIPEGPSINIIGGEPKIGKSTLADQMALSVVYGVPFLGYKTRPVDVLLIHYEQGKKRNAERLEMMQDTFDREQRARIDLSCPKPNKLRLPRDRDKFKALIHGYKLVIIDPLKYLVGSEFIKTEIAQQTTSVLQEILTEESCTVVITHHLRKKDPRGNKLDIDALKGSGDYAEIADTVMLMEWGYKTKKTQRARTFTVLATRYTPDAEPISLRMDSNHMFIDSRWELDEE